LQFYLISGLIFAFLVAIFALWNSAQVVIRFPLLGEFATSQALVIIGSAMLGALIIMVVGLVRSFKMGQKIKKQDRLIRDYEEIIDNLKRQLEEKQSQKDQGNK